MSVRYESADAGYISHSIAKAGEEIGDDTVPEGRVALVLSYDEVFYITGTPRQLRRLLIRALYALNEEEPAA